mgnify:CR=1 FL=1
MCVVSMVMDHYHDRFRRWDWAPPEPIPLPGPPVRGNFPPEPQEPLEDQLARIFKRKSDVDELRQLIKDFREAVDAAKRIDVLTKQPDCVDPKKATLEERVAALEKRLGEVGA